jgi:hypothetical protein
MTPEEFNRQCQYIFPFLSKAEADNLFDKMIAEGWKKRLITYSYTPKGDDRNVPSFLHEVVNKVCGKAGTKVTSILGRSLKSTDSIDPRHESRDGIVPRLYLGQERSFRVGGGLRDGILLNQGKCEDHNPDKEILLQHGSLLIFNGGKILHSMFPSNQDSRFNPNERGRFISLSFQPDGR